MQIAHVVRSLIQRWRPAAAALTVAVLVSMGLAAASPAATFYNIRAAHSGKCLDVYGGTPSTGNGAAVQQWQCLGARQTNQHWSFEPAGDGTYYVKARHSGKCLDVYGGTPSTGNGAAVQQWQCLGYAQSNQRWYLTYFPGRGSSVNLHAAHSDKCLDVYGGTPSTGNGAAVQQWQCLGFAQTNQRWYLDRV